MIHSPARLLSPLCGNRLQKTELQEAVKRLRLEQEYAKLAKPSQPGKDFVVAVLKDSGKKVATKYVSQYAIDALDSAMKKK